MTTPLVTWPAPAGEPPSPDYTVEAAGTPLFVYQAPVRAEIQQNDGLWTHKPDYRSERASFVLFDMVAPVTVTVRPTRPFRTAVVLPERAGIMPAVEDGVISFTLPRPAKLTVL